MHALTSALMHDHKMPPIDVVNNRITQHLASMQVDPLLWPSFKLKNSTQLLSTVRFDFVTPDVFLFIYFCIIIIFVFSILL